MGRRLVRFLMGEWEEAAAQWQAALDHDLAAGDRHDAVANARWLADALLVLGEERRAAEVLHHGPRDRRLGPPGAERGLAPRAPGRARHHRAGPGRRPPGPVRGACWPAATTGEVWWARWLWPASAVALRDTDWRAAGVAAEQAVTVFEDYRLPWRQAAALQAWGRALAGSGRADEARARRGEADAVLAQHRGPGAVADRRTRGGREAAPDLNATSTREHHTRAMTTSHCPRRARRAANPRARSTP